MGDKQIKLLLSIPEEQVLALSLYGVPDHEIACKLGTSLEAVRKHWVSILVRAECPSRTALVSNLIEERAILLNSIALKELENPIARQLMSPNIGVYDFDVHSGKTLWSRSMFDLFEINPNEEPLSPDALIDYLHPADKDFYLAHRRRFTASTHPLDCRFRIVTRSGRTLHIRNTCFFALDTEKHFSRSMGTMQDETEERVRQMKVEDEIRLLHESHTKLETRQADLKRANQRLSEIANKDGLTGLQNHRSFKRRLMSEIALSREQGENLTLVLLDIDNFKAYNDAYGHPAGDRLLVHLALVLRDTTRRGDFLARYGGEEFAIILSSTDLQSATIVCETVRKAIESEPWEHAQVTASFGFAQLSAKAGDADELIRSADRALYSAKAEGKNVACAWVEEGR